jgi:hypothetical protein
MKTEDQKKKDVNALIKYILTEMEDLASLSPEIAGNLYEFQERRQQLVKRVWRTFKDINDDAC